MSRSTVSYALSGKRASPSDPPAASCRSSTSWLPPQRVAPALWRRGAPAPSAWSSRPPGGRLTPIQLGFVAERRGRRRSRANWTPRRVADGRRARPLLPADDPVGRRVDGVILMEIRLETPEPPACGNPCMPFVTHRPHGRRPDGHWAGSRRLRKGLVASCVRHLADLGHREIALINRPRELLDSGYGPARRALDGFNAAAAARSLSATASCCPDEATAGESFVEALLAARPGVTGLVTVNEAALPGIERALGRLGRAIPRQMSVTGVVGRHWAEEFHPPLTAADVPITDMAERAVELLAERLAEPGTPPRNVLLAPPISLRSSTAPPP